MRYPWLRWSLLLFPALLAWPAHGAVAESAANDFFEKEVRPLLVERCFRCHGGEKTRGSLKLTSRAEILQGGAHGPAAVPGQPAQSLLIRALHYTDSLRMPRDGKLPDRDIDILTRWVQEGLPWPQAGPQLATARGPQAAFTDEQRRFWCFQPVKIVPPPAVKDMAWPRSDIDRFILAALEARGLKPAPPAGKRTLIRRATYDLTGLPPTPREIDAFLADSSPDAFAKVVDRLLASPAYGEHWGRHWLDLVRYTDSFDSRGVGGEMDIADSYRYRDWVVHAFNRDLPYDQFIIHQLAGDLLPPREPGGTNTEGIIATGMLAIGNWGGGDADKEKLLTDIVDDQVDVVGRTFLGLTVACARCHDHKFDPIPTADYYGLAGIFFSTHILPNVGPKTNGPPMLRIPLTSPAEMARRNQYTARVAELEKQLQNETAKHYRELARSLLPQTARYVTAAWEFQHRPPDQVKLSLAEFAARQGLHEYALRRWIAYLGPGSDYPLMTLSVPNLNGLAGVHVWKSKPDCPSLTINATDKDISILTFKLPRRSVCVHPGPDNGVAVGWESPITGKVRITGRVVDGDSQCGDGIAWIIDQRSGGRLRELAAGAIPNGGAQRFDQGQSAERLASVEVKTGDLLQLLVLPKANYACDTTVVELEIARLDGSEVWNLTHDLVSDPLQGNPHRDSYQHAGVWHFYDMAGSPRAQSAMVLGSAFRGFWRPALGMSRAEIDQAARELQQSLTQVDAGHPFWIDRPEGETSLPSSARAELANLRTELETLKKNPPPPLTFANGAQEGGVPGSPQAGLHDVRIHIRGNYARLGDLVPRHFLSIIAGDRQPPITEGSGRLQLAHWIAAPTNPLTARVMVNRIWQHHFGEGIVRTPSNFGKLGEPPTHPELLDYLEKKFIDSGWSIKALHRALMLSAVYQQASEPDPATLKADPENRLLGRMSRHRLEAEAIRDSLLVAAGRLDRTLGGPATREFNSPRRTLYLMTIRSDRTGFRPLFDVADSTAPVDRRTISTVAPQALFLLNHPFVLDQTRALAQRLRTEPGSDTDRIRRAYELLYGRPASAEEARLGLAFLAHTQAQGEPSAGAWEEYCQVLLCANEFLYVD